MTPRERRDMPWIIGMGIGLVFLLIGGALIGWR